MPQIRFQALKTAQERQFSHQTEEVKRVSDIFGERVFNQSAMEEYMTPEAFKSVMAAMRVGSKIDRQIADQVAAGMKAWAIAKGATHYTHWFQPLTGSTAEKHDSFFEPQPGGGAIEKFTGSLLVQQEPDASSFPSGGIRNTFEARGYTAWDPTSTAFVIGHTLCIPTVFVSYTGEALDFKTPLLRALQSVDAAAVDVCKYFDKNVSKVQATLGWEQEYFLIDIAMYRARPDLMMTGRTLLGHPPAKGQQLDDHYFGSIPDRVRLFMRELEFECYRLGIPVKTRHNEVAPSQFELAPIFEEANISVDHNSLIMDVMDKVAHRLNFKVLTHEKPFADVNGSGKHNNWSLATNTGVNLLQPGKNPKSNLQFLTFFINTIKAVHDYSDLLRASIASAGNDHRLGANEAPPAIISIFIGSQLSSALEALEKLEKGSLSPEKKTDLKLNVVGKIPSILLDNTDRNRTSPFAFTGNKFEFRAVGSDANCAQPMTALNTIMAKQLRDFKKSVDAHINEGMKKDDAIFNVLRDYIIASKNILFEGDGYSDNWVEEAKKRGLNNVKTTPQALDFYVSEKALSLFESSAVMNRTELQARHEILLEDYQMKIQIESRVLGDIAGNHVLPTAIAYQHKLAENLVSLKSIYGDKDFKKAAGNQMKMMEDVNYFINVICEEKEAMRLARKKCNEIEDIREKAIAYCEEVKPYLSSIRRACDKLELLIDDEIWPLMKYREMLFS